MKFANGEMGAVNGIAADGTLIKTNEQVQEVWTGTTFGVAALDAERRYERRRLSHRVGRLSHHLRNPGLLVPHARSLGHHRTLPRLNVHAPGSNLGDGNDRAAEIEETRRQIDGSVSRNRPEASCRNRPCTTYNAYKPEDHPV